MYSTITKTGRLSTIAADIASRVAGLKTDSKGFCRFYLVRTVGLNKHAHYSSAIGDRLLDLLDDVHMRYTCGNDAPKGGKLGEFVRFNAVLFVRRMRDRCQDAGDKAELDKCLRALGVEIRHV